METEMTDFVVGSNKFCFLCSDQILSPVSPFKQKSECGLQTFSIKSLQHLASHLRLDMSKVFTEEGSAPAHLLKRIKKARLKVELCEECTSLNDTFSKLCPKLEKIEMEVKSCITSIHQKLMQATKTSLLNNSEDDKDDNTEGKILQGKREIVTALRSELIRKCSNKIAFVRPQVKIQRLTMGQVNRKRRAFISQRKQTNPRESKSWIGGIQIKMESSNHGSDQDDYGTGNDLDPDNSDSQSGGEESHLPTESSASTNARIYPIKRRRVIKNNSALISNSNSSDEGKGISEREVGQVLKSKFNPENRRYHCRICNKSFKQEGSCQLHYNSSHLQIRVECTLCKRTFSQQGSYSRHHRDVHANVKLFKCNVCDYTSTRKHNLTMHVDSIHIGKRIRCRFCSMTFSKSWSRNLHMRKTCQGKSKFI